MAIGRVLNKKEKQLSHGQLLKRIHDVPERADMDGGILSIYFNSRNYKSLHVKQTIIYLQSRHAL